MAEGAGKKGKGGCSRRNRTGLLLGQGRGSTKKSAYLVPAAVRVSKREQSSGHYPFGVGGVATFKNAKKLKEVIETIPLETILLETDCPYMAPEPYRGKRNSSLYLPYVVEKIAGLKGVTAKEVEEVTYRNAEQLFLGK